MLNWLKSLFSKKGTNTKGAYDVYYPTDRLVYSYWNGSELIKVDPLTLYKRFIKRGPEIDKLRSKALEQTEEGVKAHSDLLVILRELFNLKPMEEGGLSEIETLEAFDHFFTYCASFRPAPVTPPKPKQEVPPEIKPEVKQEEKTETKESVNVPTSQETVSTSA